MLDIQGRVIVYSVTGCPHCMSAKKSLKDAGVPIIDVSLDRFPSVRSWLQVCGTFKFIRFLNNALYAQ